jgi:hypothetical protein
MNEDERRQWLPLILLATALVVWASFLALGAVLQWGDERRPGSAIKGLAILSGMCVFLAAWGVALWYRSRRK